MQRSKPRLRRVAILAATAAMALMVQPVPSLADTGSTVPAATQQDRLVRSSDGTVLAVYEWGDPARPTIILIHGYLQSYLSFERQIGPLSRKFHVVALDLRGHGGSDKPLEAAAYREAWRWADDIHAVIAATTNARARPVLLGWSMGGRVIGDYLQKYGQDGLSGVIFVDAGLKRGRGMAGTANAGLITDALSPALDKSIAATRAFLQACFNVQPSAAEFEKMMAYNMVVPPVVRTYLAGRSLDFDETLAGLTRPTLVIQGEKDALVAVASAQYTAHQVPGARLLIYPNVGHSPFWEAADRFNSDVAGFVTAISSGEPQ